MDELLTAEELAKYLKTSVANLHYLRHVGNAPPAIKVGRQLRFRRSDVEAWMEGQLAEQRQRA